MLLFSKNDRVRVLKSYFAQRLVFLEHDQVAHDVVLNRDQHLDLQEPDVAYVHNWPVHIQHQVLKHKYRYLGQHQKYQCDDALNKSQKHLYLAGPENIHTSHAISIILWFGYLWVSFFVLLNTSFYAANHNNRKDNN